MKDKIKAIGLVLGFLAILAIPIAMGIYKYNDCRKVGHSIFYCILDLG